MRRDDYILMASLALLNAFPETRGKIVRGLLNDQVFELTELRQPQKFSLGFRFHSKVISISEGLAQFDNEGFLGAQVILAEKDARPLLQVSTVAGTRTFDLEVTFSSPFAMDAQQIIELLDAQNFSQEIWQSVLQFINASNKLNSKTQIDIGEIKKYLLNPENQNHFNMLVESMLELTQIETAVRGAQFQVPANISLQLIWRQASLDANSLPKHENKDPRFQASLQLQKTGSWGLAPAPARWELYLWNELPQQEWAEQMQSLEQSRTELERALQRCLDFSERVGTAFSEAFALSLYVLKDPVFKSISANPGFLLAVKTAMEKMNYSERALKVFDRVFHDAPELLNAGLTAEAVCSLKAFSIANVFGGSGSWSDQSFSKPEDNAEYKAVSTQLYQALQSFFVASLNKIC